MSLPTCLPNASVSIIRVEICRLRYLDRSKYLEVITSDFTWQYTIQFLGGNSWERVPGFSDARYNFTDADTSQGELYRQSLEAVIAFAKTSKAWAAELRSEEMLIKFVASNGDAYLMGTLDQPVTLQANHAVADTSSIAMSFQTQGRHPLYIYAPVVSL